MNTRGPGTNASPPCGWITIASLCAFALRSAVTAVALAGTVTATSMGGQGIAPLTNEKYAARNRASIKNAANAAKIRASMRVDSYEPLTATSSQAVEAH